MKTYSIWALFKCIIGAAIIWLVYTYVNVYQQPLLGIGFGLLGVFLTGRGLSYFLFLGMYKLTDYAWYKQISLSYKLSLFFGIYLLLNLALMINDQWTQTLGIAMIFFFLGLILMIWYSPEKIRKATSQ